MATAIAMVRAVATRFGCAAIVSLLGWPLDGPKVPGLALVRSPQLLPDRSLPTRGGRLFGMSTWPGMERREIRHPDVIRSEDRDDPEEDRGAQRSERGEDGKQAQGLTDGQATGRLARAELHVLESAGVGQGANRR